MAKMTKKAEARRNEIVQKAQELFQQNGYANTSVNQIISELSISKGAFYHHFSSKLELLEEIVDRFTVTIIASIQPIIARADLNPIEKLNEVFATSLSYKADNIELIYTMLKTYYSDENLLLRHKLRQHSFQATLPIMQAIFEEGKRAGCFQIQDSSSTAEMILLLGLGMSDRFAEILQQLPDNPDKFQNLENLFTAYQQSIERILGAKTGLLIPLDFEILGKLRKMYVSEN